MSKAVLCQINLFSISTQLSSIRPIDRILFNVTTPGQRWPGNEDNRGDAAFPEAPALLKPHHQIV